MNFHDKVNLPPDQLFVKLISAQDYDSIKPYGVTWCSFTCLTDNYYNPIISLLCVFLFPSPLSLSRLTCLKYHIPVDDRPIIYLSFPRNVVSPK